MRRGKRKRTGRERNRGGGKGGRGIRMRSDTDGRGKSIVNKYDRAEEVCGDAHDANLLYSVSSN